MSSKKDCHCGEAECWDAGDYSWLSDRSGWHGDINGCDSSVFFIHGKRIREQRHIPEGQWPIAAIGAQFEVWAKGLPGARLVYMGDTGGGDPGWWIEGEREPNDDDLVRLQEARNKAEQEERRQLGRLLEKFPTPERPTS